jgi:hypothetical protein
MRSPSARMGLGIPAASYIAGGGRGTELTSYPLTEFVMNDGKFLCDWIGKAFSGA